MLGKLAKIFQKNAAPAPRVALAAFGKHPGWDDHIDDLGLNTPKLVHVKSLLYSQGISGNIDSAGWDQLSDGDRLPGFAHEFLWRWAGEAVVGVMWSSQDGKGRSKYPMVLCLQGTGLPVSWLCSVGLERLRTLRDRCKSATIASEVRQALTQAREDLITAAASVPEGDNQPERHLIRKLLVEADDTTRQGFVRILYDMERRLSGLKVDGSKRGTRVIDVSSHQFRVPKPPARGVVMEGVRAWSAVVMEEIGPGPVLSAGVLAIEAVNAGHIDLIVGDPTPALLFCIRAATTREPMTSDIPFNIEDLFASAARQRVASWS